MRPNACGAPCPCAGPHPRRTRNAVGRFQTAYRNAEIKYPVRMYDIRHLLASTMLKGGSDLAGISYIMGHASINQTQEAYYEIGLEGGPNGWPNSA
ncbi:MAG: tyrosine-type recombinase/integrase [Candidatus Binataceae bacterium]